MPAPGMSGTFDMTRYDIAGYLRCRAMPSEYTAAITAAKKFIS